MSYKCVHCSKLYDDGSKEILTGCSQCGRRFFFFIKKEKLYLLQQKQESVTAQSSQNAEQGIDLNPQEKEKIEKDVREIAGIKDEETPVFLDFESVKVLKEGKYLLDLSKLFSGKPQVYQLEDGKYIIDLSMSGKEEGKN